MRQTKTFQEFVNERSTSELTKEMIPLLYSEEFKPYPNKDERRWQFFVSFENALEFFKDKTNEEELEDWTTGKTYNYLDNDYFYRDEKLMLCHILFKSLIIKYFTFDSDQFRSICEVYELFNKYHKQDFF